MYKLSEVVYSLQADRAGDFPRRGAHALTEFVVTERRSVLCR